MRRPQRLAGLFPVIGAIRIAHVVRFVRIASGITAPKWPVAAGFFVFPGTALANVRMTMAHQNGGRN